MKKLGSRQFNPWPILALTVSTLAVVVFARQPRNNDKTPAAEQPPYWAFAVDPPAPASDGDAKPTGNALQRVPGSSRTFTLAQIADLFSVPDWHPDGHPAMPNIVAHGRKPDVIPCGYCHLPNGEGRPENASLAGLPVEYIVRQMAAFKSGRRKSSEPRLQPVTYMIGVASHADEPEVRTAAEYFASLKPRPWIRVVETSTVARTHVAGWMLVADKPAAMEPIGERIIETPENLERTELRDDNSGFIAYVPMGSVSKGKMLVTTGGAGRTAPCAICHGADLRGRQNAPSIAGRSPSYIVRQLYDMQHGSRGGASMQQMRGPVARLTLNDMIAIAAYTASLHP
jgi:cytochrome c553